ncbi:cation diffusion facilitator family transporter [Solimonas sp. SE-A11]|uniref:cation diffusion facilitator family transporter n=1 Tax=Solimonas sp. SE-A11 TaxID=3054954 RepID=UPI00259C688A|nr:cation diffusion facilitator family transporter [Solimonas sp. SE-A11]MDM4769386.1 cation diffusion facilitator family transporter [Solimonas sp. SE-A11]
MRPDLTRYAWLSLATAVFTLLLKLLAWKLTGSVGLLSDALESLVNLGGALMMLSMLRIAAMPPDAGHAYGHSKAEYFSSIVEGLLIVVASGSILWAALPRLLDPRPLESAGLGLAVSVAASAVNLAVAQVLLRAGRQHRSIALTADGHHLMTDVWTSGGVVLGVLLVSLTGWNRLDPLLAIAVALNVLWTGRALMLDSVAGLMDAALPPEDLAQLEAVLDAFRAEGIGFHAVRTRRSASRRFISMHVLVPGDWSVRRGHALVEDLEQRIAARLAPVTVLTHLEPIEDAVSYGDEGLDRP